jgi:hypothetical protein
MDAGSSTSLVQFGEPAVLDRLLARQSFEVRRVIVRKSPPALNRIHWRGHIFAEASNTFLIPTRHVDVTANIVRGELSGR